MADYYTQFSMMIDMPDKDAWDKAYAVASRVENEIAEGEDGYCGLVISVDEYDGLWIFAEDCGEPNHLEQIVKAVVEECGIDKPITVTWAHTCSKARLDAFGGGGFCVRRGKDTIWVDAGNHLREAISNKFNKES